MCVFSGKRNSTDGLLYTKSISINQNDLSFYIDQLRDDIADWRYTLCDIFIETTDNNINK